MCITTARAKLSDTLIYTGSAFKDGKDVHVLAYQNNATSYPGWDKLSTDPNPNAMVLPFPTSDEMDERNIIDTRSFKSFLKDITNASKMRTRSLGFDSRGMTKGVALNSAKVFSSGSYTVVLAENVNQIPEALERVPENRRPTITERFLVGYGQLYPNQPIAVCCWDGTIQAEPLLWWYTPRDKNSFFIPTMDAHDGNPPKLTEAVQTDHIISVGSANSHNVGHHYPVLYKDSIPKEAAGLLPTHVYGTKLGSTYKNGDMFVDTNKLSAGSKAYQDLPKAYRGVSFAEASTQGTKFEMFGWA